MNGVCCHMIFIIMNGETGDRKKFWRIDLCEHITHMVYVTTTCIEGGKLLPWVTCHGYHVLLIGQCDKDNSRTNSEDGSHIQIQDRKKYDFHAKTNLRSIEVVGKSESPCFNVVCYNQQPVLLSRTWNYFIVSFIVSIFV